MGIKLKRLLAKSELQNLIQQLTADLETTVAIQDLQGQLLWGICREISPCICPDACLGPGPESAPKSDPKSDPDTGDLDFDASFIKHPILLQQAPLGWVVGNAKAASVASLISYVAERELEKKEIARETLEKYKEINLLYKLSERMSAHLDLNEVARLVIQEAQAIITATNGAVMLLDPASGQLNSIATFGPLPPMNCTLGQGFLGMIAQTGRADIANNVEQDPRCQSWHLAHQQLHSRLGVPLRVNGDVLGVIGLGCTAAEQYSAADLKLMTAIASQAAAAIENAILHENKLKEARVKSNLERYLSAQVVDAIVDIEGNFTLEPTQQNLAILFSDIRNFTTKCEELPPAKIVGYLNEYFTHMVDVIFGQEGTINKFVGDMIVAFFGAPSPMIDSEHRAIATAIQMQKRLQEMPESWIRENFHTGIGISSGDVVVGNVGSPQHMDYTAIGDEVNLASRLQGMAKGGQILVSRSIHDATRDWFDFVPFGQVPVKGKREGVEVFEVRY